MILGYYTIPLKTISRNQLPPELPVERGASFQCGLRVFHILFIPIFPFEKLWMMKIDGKSYKVNPEMSKFFDQAYGRPKTPIYGFAGILLGLIAFGYFTMQSSMKERKGIEAQAARKEKAEEELLARIKEPTTEDYYALSADNKTFYEVKVDKVLPDSVVLRYVQSDLGSKRSNNMGTAFVLDQASFLKKTIAKLDVKNSHYVKGSSAAISGMVLPGLANETPLKLYNAERKKDGDFHVYLKEGDALKAELQGVVQKFVTQMSIDSSLVMLDADSKKYLLEVARLARVGDKQKMNEFIRNSGFRSATYSIMLHAYYSFCVSMKGKFPVKDDELLKEFGFYTKLLNVGLWSIDDHIKSPRFSSVEMKSRTQASVLVKLISNILQTRESIGFYVILNKEGGKWKVNLPSTFGYTKFQVMKVGNYDGDKTYRKMVRDQLEQLNPELEVSNVFNY